MTFSRREPFIQFRVSFYCFFRSRRTVYLTLLNSINPAKCPKDAISLEDVNARAVAVIENARALEVPVMIQSSDITSGNRKLNLAFVAQIFNTNHGLEMKAEEMKVSTYEIWSDARR